MIVGGLACAAFPLLCFVVACLVQKECTDCGEVMTWQGVPGTDEGCWRCKNNHYEFE